MNSASSGSPLHVGLFATCPVDLIRPSVGFATAKLLEQAGCRVSVPPQSCCGQVAFNNGDPQATRKLAWRIVEDFEPFDYVVLPSGSCGGMIRLHYPALFRDDSRFDRVERFCAKVYELTTFLAEVIDYQPAAPNCNPAQRNITYHDSCAGLRELNIRNQPRQLLKRCAGVDITEMRDTEACCGFGGTFCVKFPAISNRMVTDKVSNARDAGADLLLGGDLSCLLNIAGKIQRQQSENPQLPKVQVRHVAEVLAGDLDAPAIGEGTEAQIPHE
ncbi:(Fe-S)-binding protein [Microbulbifer sp.]|uniref:(Fe-S)-binding protein n=1 Tax=Microbulbifer sp. TaxID=1908541 RepID=UPI003F3FDA8B